MREKPSLVKQILPREKGAYAMVGEPILLGLLAAYSFSGALVAMVGVLSIFLRQALINSFHKQEVNKFVSISVILASIVAGLLVVAVKMSFSTYLLIPLLMAAPLFILQIYADIKHVSRKLHYEITGVLSPGSFAASIAIASGEHLTFGFMLWFVSSGRALPTFLYVRNRVRMIHNKHTTDFPVVAVHYLVLLISFFLVFINRLPQALVFVMALYLIRTMVGLYYPVKSATIKKIGYSELVYGAVGMSLIGASIGLF